MSTEIYPQPEIVCEMCGEVCTDDFLVYEWPGAKNGWCLCPDCHQEAYESMIENPYLIPYQIMEYEAF